MTVPKQVQASADAADKLQQSLVAGENQDPGKADPAPSGQETAPVVPPKDQDSPADPNHIPASDGDLNQKYRSLLGRCESQVRENKQLRSEKDLLYKQVADLNRKVLTLEQDLEEAKKIKPEPADRGSAPQDDTPSPLDVKAFEQYGPEFGKLAETLNNMLDSAKQTPSPVKEESQIPEPAPETQPAGSTESQPGISMQQLKSDLISDVYMIHKLDFNLVDQASEFVSWLNQYDQQNGQQNVEEWKEAVQVRDKDLCLQVINKFLGSSSGQSMVKRLGAKPEPTPAPNQQPDISAPGQDPETVPDIQKGRIWKRSEILAFYTELSKPNGKYANDPDEAKRLEADVQAAPAQGRVIEG